MIARSRSPSRFTLATLPTAGGGEPAIARRSALAGQPHPIRSGQLGTVLALTHSCLASPITLALGETTDQDRGVLVTAVNSGFPRALRGARPHLGPRTGRMRAGSPGSHHFWPARPIPSGWRTRSRAPARHRSSHLSS